MNVSSLETYTVIVTRLCSELVKLKRLKKTISSHGKTALFFLCSPEASYARHTEKTNYASYRPGGPS